MNRILCVAAFCLGLAAVAWVGAGYVGTSSLALTMTALIGAVYVAGALELLRFDRATVALERALAVVPADLPRLGAWLERLPAALRNPVRLRIEGERAGLPGPALAPYLVGLLVLLGMLGTFLGMVVTLQGAVLALESTTDLQTIRGALAAPVKGLGVAFGTSVAGVAASAMLGLISALCRRARLRAAQSLDSRIGAELRGFSLAHQRQESFKALQQQAAALPRVVDRLEAMMAQLERHSEASGARLLAGQERFHRETGETYAALAASVERSLQESLGASARLAGETLQPAVEATMAGIARETAALQAQVGDAIATQLEGLATRFDDAVGRVSETWVAALAAHERSSERVSEGLQAALAAYTETFAQRSAGLVAATETAHRALAERMQHTLDAVTAGVAQRAAELLAAVHEANALARSAATEQDEARRTALGSAVESMAAALQREWRQAGALAEAREARLCQTLDETARGLAAATAAQARDTIEEVGRLVQAAAEAPRAAAEVIAQLRQQSSASLAHDNALLEERSRLMETLDTLLAAIKHAAGEQRQAIDALVASSAAMLERTGAGFAARIEAQRAQLDAAAERVSGGALELASLGEAFAGAVAQFGTASERMMGSLGRIEGALDKSLARSDEQLAYYVAQAREIVDLSILSQKQILEDLQRLSTRQAALAGEA